MASDQQLWAVDTSVAVAALDAQHMNHMAARSAVLRNKPVLAGHAAFESFSVLTRLPGDLRISNQDAHLALSSMFGTPCWMSAKHQTSFFGRLATLGIVGGATYDALVGEAARVNDRTLLTNDARASRTYQLIDVEYLLLASQT
jgi:hypothetical protein